MKPKNYLRYKFLVLLVAVAPFLAGAQSESVVNLYLNATTDDFETIRQNVESYFKDRNKGRGTGYKQWKRWEDYNRTRLTPDGKVTNIAARNWEAFYTYNQGHPEGDNTLATFGYWYCNGPFGYTNGAGWNPGIGRVNVICFHPADPNTFWIGTPSGGLWKTTAGGNAWTPLTDGMPQIGVSGIAVQPDNTNIIYILTGDGDGSHTNSIGVMKTIDGGVTWLSTGLSWTITDDKRGYKLLMHPSNYNVLLAATSDGIYKTSNGGYNWTKVLNGWFYDIEFKPGDPTYVYTCGGTSFFRSTNTGDNWTQITSGVPNNAWRMAIGVTPADAAMVYLFTGPPTGIGYFVGVYRSVNSGSNFSLRSNSPNLLGYAINGWDDEHQTTYDLAMTVSRSSTGTLIVGGINTWRSTDGGASWTLTSLWNDYYSVVGYTHADIHDLAINPLNNSLYCCSDGGIFRSTDFGENWTDLSYSLCHTQWYRIAGTEANSSLIIGGTQDNGSDKWTGGSTYQHILGADGMDCIIDYTNSNIMYYESQGGDVVRSADGGSSYASIKPYAASGPWITPLLMSRSDHQTLYAGYDTIRKSTNSGGSWFKIGVGVASGNGAMAMGINNTSVIYAASNWNIWRSDNGGTSWTSIRTGLPFLPISFIAVNPDNSSDVFITFGSYSAGQKVYSSSNAGASWNNISGTLPNVPAACIAYEDNNGSPDDALYVGTDIGIYYRNAGMSDWIPFMNGLPTVPVLDLEINKTANVIRAGTFGRGLWTSELYSACPPVYTLTAGNDPSNPHYTGIQHYEASQAIESSRIITGGLGTNVYYQSGNYIKLTTGFNARENNVFRATLGPCNAVLSKPGFVPVTGRYAGRMKE